MQIRNKIWGPVAVATLVFAGLVEAGNKLPNPLTTTDPSGTLQTFSTGGAINVKNAFFADLGSNGRSCNSCHVSSTGWSVSPSEVKARFDASGGKDPIFRPVDGAVCPSADTSTVAARKSAYSLLLNRGLIRVSMSIPASADFHITSIDDPYSCAETTATQPALYRRPLPATNLPFLAGVMWDGRESPAGRSLHDNLMSQALDATLGHAQASAAPSQAQLEQIVQFESALFTAQATDSSAGRLDSAGATGGAAHLSAQPFYLGINDVFAGDSQTGEPFDPNVFTLYDSWLNSPSKSKASIARGESLFNSLMFPITGVSGVNDSVGTETIMGTCSSCHDAPNVGNHSVPLALNIGVADFPGRPGLDISGLPVYTVECDDGTTVRTTDLGRAMVTGKCSDIGKTKGPILRGLAARAPYFHNGSAATLEDVIDFYDSRFNINLTPQQKKDLVAFLKAL